MKKSIILFLLLVITICSTAQTKGVLLVDSLHFSKIRFGGILIGSSINKVVKKMGKPSKIEKYDGKGDMDDVENPQNTYYFDKSKTENNTSIGFLEYVALNKGVVSAVEFNNYLPLDELISMGEDIKTIAQKFPNSYKYSLKRGKIDKKGNGSISVKIFQQPPKFIGLLSIVVVFENGKVLEIYTPKDE